MPIKEAIPLDLKTVRVAKEVLEDEPECRTASHDVKDSAG
jgi:hypothetical protein